MRKPLFILLFSSVVAISCTEEYDLQLNPETKLVINAEITNGKPPYYTQLGISGALKTQMNHNVDDALIIISDDEGVVDTLVQAKDSTIWYITRYKDRFGEDSTRGYAIYDNIGVIDSMYVFDPQLYDKGYFQTTKLKGKAGHTYFLKVEWQGHTYTSECKMPEAIKIDTITHRKGDKFIDGTDGDIPYVWFRDNPNEDNYYIFKKGIDQRPLPYSNGQGTWSVSIFSDEYLTSDAKGMDICGGEATESWRRDDFFFYIYPSQKLMMYSVTKEVYNYYSALINQIRYDGGVYTPSPASAPTNINGGALGVFNAASFDEKYCLISKDEYNEKYGY